MGTAFLAAGFLDFFEIAMAAINVLGFLNFVIWREKAEYRHRYTRYDRYGEPKTNGQGTAQKPPRDW